MLAQLVGLHDVTFGATPWVKLRQCSDAERFALCYDLVDNRASVVG